MERRLYLVHMVSAQLPEGLVTMVDQVTSQPGLCAQAQVKTVDTKAQGNVPACKSSKHIVTHQCQKLNAIYDFIVKGQLEAPHLHFPGLCPQYITPLD